MGDDVKFLKETEWISDLIPDLESYLAPYVVEVDEIDDELLSIFLDEMRRLKSQLQQAVIQKDMQEIRIAAHSIKGMGGTVGIPELSVFGEKLGSPAKNDQLNEIKNFVEGLATWLSDDK